jgi:ethanolamine utilization protein EutN
MFLAKVVGNVWATRKIPVLENKKLLLIQPIDPITGKTAGLTQLAVCHTIDAGIGDTVIILDEGSSAKQHLGTPPTAVRTFVFAIVDQVRQGDKVTFYT